MTVTKNQKSCDKLVNVVLCDVVRFTVIMRLFKPIYMLTQDVCCPIVLIFLDIMIILTREFRLKNLYKSSWTFMRSLQLKFIIQWIEGKRENTRQKWINLYKLCEQNLPLKSEMKVFLLISLAVCAASANRSDAEKEQIFNDYAVRGRIWNSIIFSRDFLEKLHNTAIFLLHRISTISDRRDPA